MRRASPRGRPRPVKSITNEKKALVDLIRRVNDPTHGLREGEERNDLAPVAPPALGDGGILAPPGPGIELVELLLGSLGVLGPVDLPQRRGDGLALLP